MLLLLLLLTAAVVMLLLLLLLLPQLLLLLLLLLMMTIIFKMTSVCSQDMIQCNLYSSIAVFPPSLPLFAYHVVQDREGSPGADEGHPGDLWRVCHVPFWWLQLQFVVNHMLQDGALS